MVLKLQRCKTVHLFENDVLIASNLHHFLHKFAVLHETFSVFSRFSFSKLLKILYETVTIFWGYWSSLCRGFFIVAVARCSLCRMWLGTIEAFSELCCEVVFHPSYLAPLDAQFALQIHGGGSDTLQCTAKVNLLVRPKTIVFGRTSVLRMMFFYFFFPSARSPSCVGRPAWNFARWSVLGRIL